MRYLPISLNLQAKNIVFAGGGTPASSKVRLMLDSEAHITVIALTLNADLKHHYGQHKIHWIKAAPDPDHIANYLNDCTLFYAATGDKQLDTALATVAKAHATLVTAVDQPALGDFITPAFINRNPITIAIATEGTAPVLARLLKARIENLIPKNIGMVSKLAGTLRYYIEQNITHPIKRRKFWEYFLFKALADADFNPNRPIDANTLIADFETHEAGALGSKFYFLRAGHLLDDSAKHHLRYSDCIYYPSHLCRNDLLSIARREADFFPDKIPTLKSCLQYKKNGMSLFVIADIAQRGKMSNLAKKAGLDFADLSADTDAPITRKSQSKKQQNKSR